MKELRIAIIGCGKIADQHILAINRINYAKIVGVCDSLSLMAEQLAERYRINYFTTELSELLEKTKPDVVHITTPPQSHFSIAEKCIEAGCHVYVEKPFTIDSSEAVKLINCASRYQRKLTAGHNLQYSQENKKARALIRSGFLGGRPIYIESYYTYNLLNDNYAKALLSDKDHWIRKLPGKLLHNIISHAVARIAEYLDDENLQISIIGYTSPAIKEFGEFQLVDELRVQIFDGYNTTAIIVFTSQLKPPINKLRIFGTKNGLEIDNLHRTLVRLQNKSYKSYLNYFLYPKDLSKEYFCNSVRNLLKFFKNDFHDDSGMKNLIEEFYDAVRNNKEVPISYQEIILTCKIMDSIFSQIRK